MAFSKDFRGVFANRVARHYDKYCEITNPLTFCPLEDVYKQAFTMEEWRCFITLQASEIGRRCLKTSSGFELYLPGNSSKAKYGFRKHIQFEFPDDGYRPDIEVAFDELRSDVRERIETWVAKATQLKLLRVELHQRVNALVDDGWERNVRINSNGHWCGGPTSGMGCNTPGQVHRIWPELLPFMDVKLRSTVRGASGKSRLPTFIKHYGTPEQFMCQTSPINYENEDELMTDDETKFERRKFEALTHILVQMSLMIDVPHVRGYPTMHGIH